MQNSPRILSLDAFRGLTIAAMLIVNNMGDYSNAYAPLRHAAWHGWTPTDLIFPFFVFILGAAIPLSQGRRLAEGTARNTLLFKILRRSLIIFALGFLIHLVPDFNFATVRIPGVLQRIALCYLGASLIHLYCPRWAWFSLAIFLLALHTALLVFVSVPGYGAGVLGPQGNLAWYLDSTLLGAHTYEHAIVRGFDPEGILSTLTAVASALVGVMAGERLISREREVKKSADLLGAGLVCLIAGLLLDRIVPINKNLWTASYVLFTGGAALVLLVLFVRLVDVKGRLAAVKPFLVLGSNSIAVYFLSSFVAKLLSSIKIASTDGTSASLKSLIYSGVFASWMDPYAASFAYAFTYMLIWLGVMWVMYKKEIFIKI